MYGGYLPNKPRNVLVLGSGALQIGQAGEFDYSGSQACKALREEGIRVVLINPNIATIQTSHDLADRVYLHALLPEFVERVIVTEEVDALLLSFGGQTALNCGLELVERGVVEKYGLRILGTSVDTIRDTEDRARFIARLDEIGVITARSVACHSIEEAQTAVKSFGFPVMLRGGFALGGKGSGIVEHADDLPAALRRAFDGGVPQILVEECLRGWKEIEYEVVRDARDNCITVCNMENLDPMGIHTGESIVVAPSQTLNDEEYQLLRSIAIRVIRHLGIVGECNIQYALDPHSLEYRVIEVNARLSRSSALASKATGYPLAYVAAKLSIGYTLSEIPNAVTRCTSAFFEPALDYIVCKMPRWDLGKFQGASERIGSEMKSVGEVMAIGRTFPEVIQKALRMLDFGAQGLDPDAYEFDDLRESCRMATPIRIFAIAAALKAGIGWQEICELSDIDPWFVRAVEQIVRMHQRLEAHRGELEHELLLDAKRLGFSDAKIAGLTNFSAKAIRERRRELDLLPHYPQIDTLAAEFPAETNYTYATYHAQSSDLEPSWRKKVLVLGSGAYRIGSSVEFDWCCVNAVQAARESGIEAMMMNYNPETVSTDYDQCDKLIFDELSAEAVLDLCEREKPLGVVISMGGQIPNTLAMRLAENGVPILGTSSEYVDRAEDRSKFSALLDELDIDQPRWTHVTDMSNLEAIVDELGGFPVLVRPSYVLSGSAMSVAHEVHELHWILDRAIDVSPEHPVVVSKFETHAREIEFDAVADQGQLVLWAISEHVEDAGVHSGDATLVLPPQSLYISTLRRIKHISAELARALNITGPFNVQFLAKSNSVKVIECNLRASRSFPFVSKVTGVNFAREAMRRMLGTAKHNSVNSLDLDYVGVKVPMFSFSRLVGADPVLGVEMASTGEVGCIGDDLSEALLLGLLAAGFKIPSNGVLLSLGPLSDKYWFTDEARSIAEDLQLPLYATEGTAEMLEAVGIDCTRVGKADEDSGSALAAMDDGRIDMVINIPRSYDDLGRPDGYLIRRRAVDIGIPLITDLQLARAVINALKDHSQEDLHVRAWGDYLERDVRVLI